MARSRTVLLLIALLSVYVCAEASKEMNRVDPADKSTGAMASSSTGGHHHVESSSSAPSDSSSSTAQESSSTGHHHHDDSSSSTGHHHDKSSSSSSSSSSTGPHKSSSSSSSTGHHKSSSSSSSSTGHHKSSSSSSSSSTGHQSSSSSTGHHKSSSSSSSSSTGHASSSSSSSTGPHDHKHVLHGMSGVLDFKGGRPGSCQLAADPGYHALPLASGLERRFAALGVWPSDHDAYKEVVDYTLEPGKTFSDPKVVTMTERLYNAKGCHPESLVFTRHQVFTITEGEYYHYNKESTIEGIDAEYKQYVLTIHMPAYLANSTKGCADYKWRLNEPVNLVPGGCPGWIASQKACPIQYIALQRVDVNPPASYYWSVGESYDGCCDKDHRCKKDYMEFFTFDPNPNGPGGSKGGKSHTAVVVVLVLLFVFAGSAAAGYMMWKKRRRQRPVLDEYYSSLLQ